MTKKVLMLFSLISSLALSAKEEFVSSAKGYNGDIKVKVSIENKKISKIDIVSHQESGFTRRAMRDITNEIVETQSVDVDTVAGATYTSEGIKNAVAKAVSSSGVTLKKIPKKASKAVEYKDTTTDVVVVGGGGAGLTAAISATELGAKVIVLEKMPMVGGNTNYATGGLNAADTDLQKKLGIKDSVELYYKDTMKGGKNLNDPTLLKTMASQSKDIINWLIGKGADLTEISYSGGQSVKRIHRPTGGKPVGPMVVETLNTTLEQMNVDLRTNNQVTEILKNGDTVSGVIVKAGDKEYKINAKSVIMATGGFGANPDMVVKFNPKLKGFGTTNNPAITGEGITIVEKAGGALTLMEQIQTHPTVAHNTGNMITESVRGEGAILVNRAGKRFVNELETRDVVSKAELEQEGKSAFLIFDANTRANLSAINKYVNKGLTKEANSVEELGKILNINEKALKNTIEKYNGFVKGGKDEEFGKKGLPREIGKAPFYAIEVSPAVHHTMGGVKINEKTEVLDKNGKTISGLYAAGEITGGVHGGNRIGGNAITDITVFGKISGEEAAKNALKK